jgi:hypothetical protein
MTSDEILDNLHKEKIPIEARIRDIHTEFDVITKKKFTEDDVMGLMCQLGDLNNELDRINALCIKTHDKQKTST